MTLFFISAALLVLLSVGWLTLGLFRSNGAKTDQEAVNITLARERRNTLDNALADGSIDQATYDYERQQLEYDLAADLRLEQASTTRPGGQLSAAVLVCVFIPVAAGALYLQLGNPDAITQPPDAPIGSSDASAQQGAQAIAELLPQMEERLQQTPDDIEGWRLLGRSYLSMGEFDKARSALETAVSLDDSDVPTIVQFAEATAMTKGGEMAGEPAAIVTRALSLDPDNEHAIWLGAIAQQQIGNHDVALQGFNRLAAMAQDNPQAMATIEEMRSRSIAAMAGLQQNDTDTTLPDDNNPPSDLSTSAAAESTPSEAGLTQGSSPSDDASDNVSIAVTVALSEEALAASAEDQVVFIYARATNGPPMPLAVSRLSVADLPTTVTLDNSMAMIPTMTLSSFPSVTVGARVSVSGEAIAQTGDWFSEATDIDPANTDSVELNIDQQTP